MSHPAAPRTFRAIAVQPKWSADDFVSADAFRAWMRSQLELAGPHLHPTQANLVVLTELNGLPLVLRGFPLAARAGTFERAALLLFLTRLPSVLPVLLRERVSPIRALQLSAWQVNTRLYLHTCRDLAREYGVYLCCGSTPMPRLSLRAGRVVRKAGMLTNQTVILDPQGRLIGATDKVHLTPAEEAQGVDLTPGLLSELRVFPTPVGDLGVGISLDAFRADVVGRLEAQGCTVLLQPDANGAPWTSLEGLPPDPTNVRDQPVAWLESAWTATTTGRSIRYAVNPMVVGNLLDLSFDGQSAVTGRAEDAPDLKSYVLTDPRPGFLALAPWVQGSGTPGELRQLGLNLSARSGHPRENTYRTDLLHADLTLPAMTLTPPPRTPHEEALEAVLAEASAPVVISGRWLPLAIVAGLAALVLRLWRRRR
ncbi:nitrilase-related carbon-nitrogen hydrolase [Deinococcus sp. QL22]|uniref:nitrilase-related carbon-nitrogen hydrolase n=1 Tax=Deinococcus sp. QL22 TaxID=2939437 RepID=UPI0020182384|nr:nitrilase-related carbon-nitrogen hydrolase [Deinococcus sp. QL22]UQN05060.1 carbon-nitrogen hydrolase family protein [Deinococcus sp. QL22]